MHILIVEDEPGLQLGLTDLFEEAGFQTTVHGAGKQAIAQLSELAASQQAPFDALVLDLGLPDIDGGRVLEYCHEFFPSMPVLVLTARANETDVLLGFKMGAFDYVTKPFAPRILLARVNALLRRQPETHDTLVLGSITIDFERYEAEQAGTPLHLTTREIEILKFLAAAEGKPVSRNDLLDEVWGMDSEAGPRTVDTHIALLRKKIEPNPDKPAFILSQRGIGYKLNPRGS